MDKVKKSVNDLEEKLEQKKAQIDRVFYNYENTMSPTDYQIRIQNRNDSYLDKDQVYNSPHASEQLREAIRTRTLNGLTPEEFSNKYKQALYGVSGEGKIQDEDFLEQDETALIVPKPIIDMIPVAIGRQLVLRAGHTEKYLLGKAREYGLTLGQLIDFVDITKKYGTNFPAIFSLLNSGLSFEEASLILETRENASLLLEDSMDRPSLKSLADLYKQFGSGGIDEDDLADMAHEIHSRVRRKFYDSSIKIVLQQATERGYCDLEQILDSLEGTPMGRVEAATEITPELADRDDF